MFHLFRHTLKHFCHQTYVTHSEATPFYPLDRFLCWWTISHRGYPLCRYLCWWTISPLRNLLGRYFRFGKYWICLYLQCSTFVFPFILNDWHLDVWSDKVYYSFYWLVLLRRHHGTIHLILKIRRLFAFSIFWLSEYLMNVIHEMHRAH